MIVCAEHIYGQVVPKAGQQAVIDPLLKRTEFIITDSGLVINYATIEACKTYSISRGFIPAYAKAIPEPVVKTYLKTVPKTKLITIHGNVSYDFYYRSQIDTPFYQTDLRQHTERIWLDIMIKEKYPFRVGFTARQSNSPFYKDVYQANLNFDKYGYTKNLKQALLNRLVKEIWQNPYLKTIDSALAEQMRRYQALKNYINGPEALQRLIEEKERNYYNGLKKEAAIPENPFSDIAGEGKNKLGGFLFKGRAKADSAVNKQLDIYTKKADSLIAIKDGYLKKADSTLNSKKDRYLKKADSLVSKEKVIYEKADSTFSAKITNKKEQLDSLEKSIAKLKSQSDSIKKSINQTIAKTRQQIYKARSAKDLEKIAKENDIAESGNTKLQKFLSNIKTLGIGRSLVDYTELTAQNVMLTGVNVEYNPSYYAAFAAGKIDFGFRDFFGRAVKQKNQYLLLGRIGWGDKDKRAIILTVFEGRKNSYPGLAISDSSNNTARLFGYSIETIIKKNENTFLSLEVAKSTKNRTQGTSTGSGKQDNLFKYSDQSNMGYSIKGQTIIPETDTRISGFFRKTGEQFQSFSLFTYNTNQQAWQLRADQSFLKRKINLTTMLRQNDFTSPLTDKTFKTSTVFKTIQLNVRFPHYPVLNAGYYPGSQYYIVDKNTIRENAYYILNGSVLYSYRFKGIGMNSSFIYNRYFNKATDSGFVLYKGVNYILSQSLLFNKLQAEGSYSYNKQTELNYYTVDAHADYSFNKILQIGAGVKYNHVQSGKNYWGQSLKLGLNLNKFGNLQLHYEKSYLPTIQQTLYPVETGRVGWYKIF